MKVLFVQNWMYESPGLMSISAVLKKNGVKISMSIPKNLKELMHDIEIQNPNLIAFSFSSSHVNWVLHACKTIKERYCIPIILGGPHVTHDLSLIRDSNIDYICCGEGELAMLDVCNAIESNHSLTTIPNIIAKKNGKIFYNKIRDVVDLNSLPFMDRTIYQNYPKIRNSSSLMMVLGRGCPYTCSYCDCRSLNKLYHYRYYRYKDPNHAVLELNYLLLNSNPRVIIFMDSFFPLEPTWQELFLKLYVENIKLPFTTNILVSQVNPEYLLLLKNAGCIGVSVGLETGNETVRKELLKKNISNKNLLETAKYLAKIKLPLLTYNMLGLPKVKMSTELETVSLNIRLNSNYTLCNFFHPFPKTELSEECEDYYRTNKSYKSYSYMKPLVSVKDESKFIKLNYLFYFFVRIHARKSLMKILIKYIPVSIAGLFSHYNYYCYWRFHRVKFNDIKYFFFTWTK
jgi:anaerobic magnesium-protoporphyrin IX monomethyl ester cyclase